MTGRELQDGSTVITCAGDWHANSAGVHDKLHRLSEVGATRLMHVRDFRLREDRFDRRFVNQINGWAEEFGILISVALGNHDDWGHVRRALAAADRAPAMIRPQIVVLPRGHRWFHRGRLFVAVGGTATIDFDHRKLQTPVGLKELPTEKAVVFQAQGGQAKIMINHDSPGTASINRIRATANGWSADALGYANEGARRITAAWDAVAPDLFFHGYFPAQDAATLPSGQRLCVSRRVSLAAEDNPGNAIFLGLETMTTLWLEDFDDYAI